VPSAMRLLWETTTRPTYAADSSLTGSLAR
jgi:hypothetical protein